MMLHLLLLFLHSGSSLPVNVTEPEPFQCYEYVAKRNTTRIVTCAEKCCVALAAGQLQPNQTAQPTFSGCWQNSADCTKECHHSYHKSGNASICQCNTSLCNKRVIYREQPVEDTTEGTSEEPPPSPSRTAFIAGWTVGAVLLLLLLLGSVVVVLLLHRRKLLRGGGGLLSPLLCGGWEGDEGQEEGEGDVPLLPKFPNGRTMGPSYEREFELEIIRDIGYGRYGQVQQARVGDSFVAVKKFSPSDRGSFMNELMIMTEKRDVNVLRLLGYLHNESIGQLWIVSEFMPLGNLSDYLRQHTLTVRQCLHILSTFIGGVCFLHSEPQPVAHRDIKTRNVLMADHKTAKLADFGLALLLDSGPGGALNDKAAPPTQVGTARYMAPEVLEGSMFYREAEAHMRIDVYASSLVMWEVMWRTQLGTGDTVEPYMLPFERLIQGHPTPCEMQGIVVTEKKRPEMRRNWASDPIFSKLEVTLTESWDNDENARLSSKTIQARVLPLLSTENDSEVSV